MAVQRLHQVGDGLRAAPGRQGDDALSVADDDARPDGILIPVRQRIRVDPHEHSGLRGGREAELPGRLADEALFPMVVCLYCDSLLLAPGPDTHAAAPALRDPGRPLLHPGGQLQFLYPCSHLLLLLRLETSRDFSRRFWIHCLTEFCLLEGMELLIAYVYIVLGWCSHGLPPCQIPWCCQIRHVN